MVTSTQSFDTHASSQAASSFTYYIHDAPANSIIVVVVQDEGSSYFYYAKNAIEAIGGSRTDISFRSSYALLGYKGNYKMNWVTEEYSTRGNGPSVIRKTIQLANTKDAILKLTPQGKLSTIVNLSRAN